LQLSSFMGGGILVFVEHQNGKLARPGFEALVAAQDLARNTNGAVSAIILGSGISSLASEVAQARVSEVLTVDSALLERYTADGYASALRQVIEHRTPKWPKWVVFSHTYCVRDFAPKLAAVMHCGLISDCLGYRCEEREVVFVRQMFQGKFNADVQPLGDPPYFVSFQAGAFREDLLERGESSASVTTVPVDLEAGAIRTHPGERFRETKQQVDLGQAEIIVAVGRGIRAPEYLALARKLADALGGELGASRPICDEGWLPMDRQIGSSGQTVAPKLYIALGVSGAIQHQVGMKASKTIVAVNKDREAPIFEIASYGIVGDLFEVVPPLIDEIKKATKR
jgi:electron transfer flavoprotein alpha subunit